MLFISVVTEKLIVTLLKLVHVWKSYNWGTTIQLEGDGGYGLKKNNLIPNVAEKNILILVEEKKII